MNELEVLQKVSLQIFREGVYHGSGVLINVCGSYYVITAEHVFGEDVSDVNILSKFYGKSEFYGDLIFDCSVGAYQSNKDYDIAVILVKKESRFPDFPNIKFCKDISYPDITFIFRGTQKSPSQKFHSVSPCSTDTPINEKYIFCLKIPMESYTDTKGNVGAQVLLGYSGSGIFIRNVDEVYLVGITQNVDSDSFTGVNCRSIEVVKRYFLPQMEISEFHGGNRQLKLNVAEIRENITKEMIQERKRNNYGDVENLTSKMDAFLDKWTNEDLDSFINDILVWENIEHNKVRNNSLYRRPIENAKAIWASGNKKYLVETVQKGNERFHKILDEFTEILKCELDGTPIKSSSSVIAAGEVARLLANCNLSFKK